MNADEKNIFFDSLERCLVNFHQNEVPLLGVVPFENRRAFLWQVIDSVQRVRFIDAIISRVHSSRRADPYDELFDPLRAAVLAMRAGDFEEACWLVFLATHFGKNIKTGWLLAAEIYGSLGGNGIWTWERILRNCDDFVYWLSQNHRRCLGRFGNHRKYESLQPGGLGTGAVVLSYVNWIQFHGSHASLFEYASEAAGGDARRAFAVLYKEMQCVVRFGRTGRFDYLTMLAKLRLANIVADSTYLHEATGPLRGARLLFDGQVDSPTGARVLERHVARLDQHLRLGMQVLEDSMCNWQKSPNLYVPFRG